MKSVVPVSVKKPVSSVKELTNDVVPRLFYEEKEQECLAKEEQIQILNAKIKRLEHLLHLKDVRIQDLTEKTESARLNNGNNNTSNNKLMNKKL
jgi:hypothetical protein